jgi:hypothetical protein
MQKLICLHDNRISRAALLATAPSARSGQPENFAANHASGGGRRRELGHMLANQSHLLAVSLVGGQPQDLLAQG